MRIDTSLSIYQKALLKELGPDYRKQLFDLEQVIYRDLGTYDIEISGGHRKKDPFAIYVWLKEWPGLWSGISACPTTTNCSRRCWMIS